MPFCQWEDQNWRSLIYAIKQKKCILMLGPDLPCENVQGQQRPLTELLANELAKKIDGKAREKINTSDLAQVAQCFLMIERDRNKLETEVLKFYSQREDLCSDIYRNLAALPFYLTVTTTPDFMFRKALEKEGKIPITEGYYFKNLEKTKDMVEEIGTEKCPLVFHLYGTIDEPDSLVLTENDILDFLVGLVSKHLPENVLGELKNEDKSFLFLGFGFRNWYLRILLHMLNDGDKKRGSFAMEQFIPQYEDQFRQTVFFFQKSKHNIQIFKEDFNNFTARLREEFKKEEKKEKDLKRPMPPPEPKNLPLVFICHAKEDKDFAAFVHDEFKRKGLNPWLDKKSLTGGEEWDKEIERAIEEIDYFMVIISKNLAAKYSGYVIKEIHLALQRKKKFRSGFRFIIPVNIDDTQLLEELKEIQSFDLTDKKNIDELIDIIKRDFKKREGR